MTKQNHQIKMHMNVPEFQALQDSLCLNNTRMAEKLFISRYTLIKAKNGGAIGIELLAGFIHNFPSAHINKFFFTKLNTKVDN